VSPRKGAASATDGAVNRGLNDDDRSSAKRRRRSSQENPTSQTFAVTDGRIALGTVEVIARIYIATDTTGAEIGRFDSLREAARAFDGGRG
jgi:hypothetical protein